MKPWIGVGTPSLAADAHHRAAQPRQLDAAAALEILEHRRLRLRRQRLVGGGDVLVDRARRPPTPLACATASVSRTAAFSISSSSGSLTIDADRAARHRGHAAEDREAHELGPDVDGDVRAERRLKAGRPAGVEQRLELRRSRSVGHAEDQMIHRGVLDDAGLGDHRRHVGDAAGGVRRADGAGQRRDRLDAVLEADRRSCPDRPAAAACASALSVSYSLTAKKTMSAGPIAAGSLSAVTRGRCRSPFGLVMRRPRARIASRCAPRARKATSAPAAASRPPK